MSSSFISRSFNLTSNAIPDVVSFLTTRLDLVVVVGGGKIRCLLLGIYGFFSFFVIEEVEAEPGVRLVSNITELDVVVEAAMLIVDAASDSLDE